MTLPPFPNHTCNFCIRSLTRYAWRIWPQAAGQVCSYGAEGCCRLKVERRQRELTEKVLWPLGGQPGSRARGRLSASQLLPVSSSQLDAKASGAVEPCNCNPCTAMTSRPPGEGETGGCRRKTSSITWRARCTESHSIHHSDSKPG